MPEPTSDPFRSLRGVAQPADPDSEFVDALLRAVDERLAGSPGAMPRRTPDRRATDVLVSSRFAAVRHSTRWWLTAAVVIGVVVGLFMIADTRDDIRQPAGVPPPATGDADPCASSPSLDPDRLEPTSSARFDSTQKESTAMQHDSTTTPGNRRRAPHAVVGLTAAAVMLLGGCGDDDDDGGATTLAKGENIEFEGDDGLGGQTLDVNAEDRDGDVTGEMRFTDPGGSVLVTIECADTATDGVVVLGGTISETSDPSLSGLVALFIREDNPDRVAIWLDEGENETCEDLLVNRHDVLDDATLFYDVSAGSDIETD